MPLKTRPLNNNVLIEVLRDDDGVSRSDENESLKYGRLVDVSVTSYHLTASAGVPLFTAGLPMAEQYNNGTRDFFKKNIGSIVRWEEFAEGGQTFEEDGKTYALIPFWRLISIEEKN